MSVRSEEIEMTDEWSKTLVLDDCQVQYTWYVIYYWKNLVATSVAITPLLEGLSQLAN